MKKLIPSQLIKPFQNSQIILTIAGLLTGLTIFSQSLTPEFIDAGYTLTDLGSIDQLPAQYGGLTIRPEEPNTLYIGGNANYSGGALYSVGLTRDPVTNHITGFSGAAVLYMLTPNIDGGVFFAPNGTLLFTRYSMNELGQILPDNTYLSTPLNNFGLSSSVGSVALVPSGYPGAGNLIFSSYNASVFYQVPYSVHASGEYILSQQNASVSVDGTATGPEGIAYIPFGSQAFPNPSMAVSSYTRGTVVVFEVGENGLPVTSTARDMVTGLIGAEGAWIDPVTGDFLFSTFGGGNKVIRISGFEAPSAIDDHSHGTENMFTIYPNPTGGTVNLRLANTLSTGTFKIYNIMGEKIMEKDYSTARMHELDLSALPSGSYVIRVQHNGFSVTQQFIKK